MSDDTIVLPPSGLAGEILDRFVDEAQELADRETAVQDRRDPEKTYHLVTFYLGSEEYAVDIGSVQEIIRAVDITPVPGAPAHVRGVINLRGKIIPVVSLRKRFGLGDLETVTDSDRIIVVEIGPKRLGMLVDRVSQVIRIPSGVVEDLPQEATAVNEQFIRGVGKLEKRLVVILDLTTALLHDR